MSFVSAGRERDAVGERAGVAVRADENEVRAGAVGDALEVGEVRDQE